MKLKLAGLLLFSQAATDAVAIDKTNYRQHLCDSGLFLATPTSADPLTANSWEANGINQDFQVYCGTKSNYEQAVEVLNRDGARSAQRIACLGYQQHFITRQACVEKWGIEYAKTCEKLKDDRNKWPAAWNKLAPTLPECNNARRR